MNYSHSILPNISKQTGAIKWHQAGQYSFKNVIVKSRLLVNKSKIARKPTTGGKCIESARGSGNMTRRDRNHIRHYTKFDKQNYAIKLFNLNLFLSGLCC